MAPELDPAPSAPVARRAGTLVAANKQFIIPVAVLLLAVVFFPGGGGRGDRIVSAAPDAAPTQPTVAQPPAETPIDLPAVLEVIEAFSPGPAPAPPAPDDDDFTPGFLPPATPIPPAPSCSTDAVADIVDSVRDPLSTALGQPVPGEALRDLAAIAAGCSGADPAGPTLDLALEIVSLSPDLGLPTVPVPQLPGLPVLPVPQEVVDALGPVADPIRTGCSNLATIALILVVLPPAAHLPFKSADLIQFLAPASSLCSLFDQAPPS